MRMTWCWFAPKYIPFHTIMILQLVCGSGSGFWTKMALKDSTSFLCSNYKH